MTPRKRIALATATAAADLDDDLALLRAALEDRGLGVTCPCWDDPTARWASFDLVVLRSTWDYPTRREIFLEWVDRVASVTKILNPPPVVRWNTDKRYLRHLERQGLPVVKTRWFAPSDVVELPEGTEYVIKPAISAGARNTARYGPGDEALAYAHGSALLAEGRMVMVQPYLGGIDRDGETALIYICGVFSHAAEKGAILRRGMGLVSSLFAPEAIAPRRASFQERQIGEQTLRALPFPPSDLLYARVDLAPDADGKPHILEVELTEPSLFIAQAPGSAERMAGAIDAYLKSELSTYSSTCCAPS